jgi:hypothetical protein
MKTKLAMLCYRVARWLAPFYFDYPEFTIKQMRRYRQELADEYNDYTRRQRYSTLGVYVMKRIAEVSREVSSMERDRELEAYEQVKIEIKYDESTLITRAGREKLKADPTLTRAEVMREEAKRRLFSAMVEGFAQSKEIDTQLYFREVSKDLRTIGIRLYFKHAK